MDNRSAIPAHIAMLVVALIYGFNYFIMKVVFREVTPFGILAIRSISGTLIFVLAARLLIRERIKNRADFIRLIFCALFGVTINQLFFLWGLSKTSEVNAAVLMITSPVFVFLIAFALKAEQMTIRKIAGLVLSFAGATLLILGGRSLSFSGETLSGDLMVMLNAASYGTYLVIVRPLLQRYHPITIVMWIYLLGACFNIPIGISDVFEVDWTSISEYTAWGVFYIIIFTTVFAYGLNAWALRIVPSSSVGIYVYLQPVIVTILSVFFVRNSINTEKIVYILLVLLGVIFVTYKQAKRKSGGESDT